MSTSGSGGGALVAAVAGVGGALVAAVAGAGGALVAAVAGAGGDAGGPACAVLFAGTGPGRCAGEADAVTTGRLGARSASACAPLLDGGAGVELAAVATAGAAGCAAGVAVGGAVPATRASCACCMQAL